MVYCVNSCHLVVMCIHLKWDKMLVSTPLNQRLDTFPERSRREILTRENSIRLILSRFMGIPVVIPLFWNNNCK